jgi:hypothetical protein
LACLALATLGVRELIERRDRGDRIGMDAALEAPTMENAA